MWVDRLAAAAETLARAGRSVSFMEVCGTHTVNAFRSGLHGLMPANVRLLSGPGCPVCVTSQGDIDLLIELGMRSVNAQNGRGIVLCTYGDMMRVTGAAGSLELARSRGADVRVVYSALDAVKLAAVKQDQGGRGDVVFAAVGFETTAPATACAVLEAQRRGLTNFAVLASHKLIMPALRALLGTFTTEARRHGTGLNVDGFLLPGHVSVILGADVFAPIVQDYAFPCVIAGFEPVQILSGLTRLTEMAAESKPQLENMYPQAVTARGNRVAQTVMEQVFEPIDACWRALGVLKGSGLGVRAQYQAYDAAAKYGLVAVEGKEPPGCRCGEVITGRCTPGECPLFGRVCTPIDPIGPCMVSSEGVCAAWFKYGGQKLEVVSPKGGGA